MSRCYQCCQENCGFRANCTCACHKGDSSEYRPKKKEVTPVPRTKTTPVRPHKYTIMLSKKELAQLQKMAKMRRISCAVLLRFLLDESFTQLKNQGLVK